MVFKMNGRKRHGRVIYLLGLNFLVKYITTCCLSVIHWCQNSISCSFLCPYSLYLPMKESITCTSQLNSTFYHFQPESPFAFKKIPQVFCLFFLNCLIFTPQFLQKSLEKQQEATPDVTCSGFSHRNEKLLYLDCRIVHYQHPLKYKF